MFASVLGGEENIEHGPYASEYNLPDYEFDHWSGKAVKVDAAEAALASSDKKHAEGQAARKRFSAG